MNISKSVKLISGLTLAAALTVSTALADSATVTAEKSANIRDKASMSGKVIGWAMKDETVSILEKGGKWSKVQLENGLTGYIHNSLLK